MAAHEGQRISEREPQALRTTPSGSEALENVTACFAGAARDDEATEPVGTAAPAAAVALSQEAVDLASPPVADECFEHGVVVGIHGGHGRASV